LEFFPSFGYFLISLDILFILGAALLAWLRPRETDPLEYLALAGGLSLALGAVGGMVLFQTGWSVTPQTGRFLILLGVLVIALGVTYHLLRDLIIHPVEKTDNKWSPQPLLLGVFGLTALAGLILLRFHQAAGLVVGPWVDSVAHTYWVQLMLAAGGVPRYLLPGMPGAFAPWLTFDATAAAFSALAKLPAAVGVLWTSLLLSALVPLSLYRLGRALWLDWKPAALAALLSAFAFTFPAYLLGWGRGTLLTLFVLFPLAAAEVVRMRRVPYRGGEFWKSFALLVILSIGVFLSDPAAQPLMVLLLAASYLARFISPQLNGKRPLMESHAMAAVALAYILVLPYLRWVQVNTFMPSASAMQAGLEPLAGLTFFIATPLDAVLVTLAVFGLVLLIIQRRSQGLVILTLLMVLLCLPALSSAFFNRGELRLALCLPAALLAGYFLAEGARFIAGGTHQVVGYLILSVEAAAFVLWGLNAAANLYPPAVILADQADMQALNWISDFTPANARFLNQPAPWQSGIFRGVDGGYWILNETGRGQLVPPPQYPSGGEAYQSRINTWARIALTLTGCSKDFWELMAQANLQYVYLKDGSGVLRPSNFDGCEGLLKVYERNGITILQVTKN
jgi:hypothetical protein